MTQFRLDPATASTTDRGMQLWSFKLPSYTVRVWHGHARQGVYEVQLYSGDGYGCDAYRGNAVIAGKRKAEARVDRIARDASSQETKTQSCAMPTSIHAEHCANWRTP